MSKAIIEKTRLRWRTQHYESWAKVSASIILGARQTSMLMIGEVELKEPKEWNGLFGVADGWSGGAGADSELYG